MSFFRAYLLQRRRELLLLALCAVLFFVTFFLYNLPPGAVLYPTVLCVLAGAAFALASWRRAKKKHERLQELSRLPAALMDRFPPPAGADDEDYQAVIEALRREQAELRSESARRYQDMTDYYTTWAHQIKTPIAAMRLMLQGEDSPLARQLSEEVRSVEQYASMVLAFVRLDSDTTDYVFREQALDPIVREAVKKFAGQFIRKKLRLTYEPIRARVLTDEKWLCFVIEQILSNAVKYTNEGGVAITWQEPDTLVIRDTGIGIAPEDLPRVFEKSYTGYNGRSDKKSSGIGLYLCRRICTRLGHRIGVSSEPGRGTAVWISLSHEELHPE